MARLLPCPLGWANSGGACGALREALNASMMICGKGERGVKLAVDGSGQDGARAA